MHRSDGEPFEFFLGGRDLEMTVIRELLEKYAPDRFHDHQLAWGAKATDYRSEIQTCLATGRTPVLIELEADMTLDPRKVVVIDHHGRWAGSDRPTSLHQVFELLELPAELWTRRHALVAANDRGYIPALAELGASRDEIAAVRAADRAAQGITSEQEQEGERAVRYAEVLADGQLTVARLTHDRTAAVADRLDPLLGGPGFHNLLVLSPRQVNFFGAGTWIDRLASEFPGGWYGGALPERGFWGHSNPPKDVLAFLLAEINNSGTKDIENR